MMDFTGEAVLALWNGVAPERRAEYDLWHTREHVPERISVPGMVGARRYHRRAGPLPEYLTLYDVAEAAVLTSRPYRDLLDNPTPWSRSMRPSFRGFLRICCRRATTAGGGTGSALAAMVVGPDADLDAPAQGLLADCLAEEPFVSTHILKRDPTIPDVPFEIGGEAPDFPKDGVILLEAFDGRALDAALPRLGDRLRAAGLGAAAETLSTYDLAYALDRQSLGRVVTLGIDDVSGAALSRSGTRG